MGSYRSGRTRITATGTVEDHLALDLRWLRRRGFAEPATPRDLDLSWVEEPAGTTVARCDVRLCLGEDGSGYIEAGPSPTVLRQRANIVALPTPFGGRRLYYVCPERGHRCEVLYLREGRLASRQAHRLSYRSQHQSAFLRQFRRGLQDNHDL